jgi:hypothetical protein
MNENKIKKCLSIKIVSYLTVVVLVLLLIAFSQKGSIATKRITHAENIRLFEPSPDIAAVTETELNKRLSNSKISSLFYRARIQHDEIYVFLNPDRWRNMSLNEKADAIEEIVQVCKKIPRQISGMSMGLNDETPQIYMYDGDSEKELALWTGEGAAIIN